MDTQHNIAANEQPPSLAFNPSLQSVNILVKILIAGRLV